MTPATVAPAFSEPALEAPGGWHAFIEALIDAVWLIDANTLTVVDANTAAARAIGVPVSQLLGRDVHTLVATPEDLQYWEDIAAGIREPIHSDSYLRRFDGTLVCVSRRVSYVRGVGRGGVYVVAMHDRTQERRAQEEREAVVADLQATLESTADGILVTDLSGRIRAFNQRFASLWNLPGELLVKRDDAAVRQWMRRSVTEPAAYAQRLATIEEATMLQSSDIIALHSGRVLERLSLPQCSRGQPTGRVFSFRDLSERIAANQRIEELASTDPLTGLPNRLLLASRFEYALAMARRDAVPFATLILDVDRFGHLNDTFGQQLGDRVLMEVAERIESCLRGVDTVARLGGDQFVMLIHAADAHGAEGSARRLLDSMRRPFVLDGMSFTVTCSIGVALHPGDGATMDELIRQANGAMMQVKQAGRASYRFHQSHDDVDLRARIRLDHAMRQALERGDFRLHYQPQVYIASGSIIGAEALLRWTDPQMGEIPPSDFIPVAEESGFIVTLGHWVLSQAVNQAAAWHAAGLSVPVSINVSALQFRQHDFVGQVATALHAAGLPSHLLELELTESILLIDAGEGLARLRALADLGVKLAIDDFGTGYSSLGYLKRFPISRLKIDRSFVRGLPGDEIDEGITQAVIDLGRALKLQVIAEGVETEAQRRFLLEAGCSQYQGFLCAPALPREAFERLMRSALGQEAGEAT